MNREYLEGLYNEVYEVLAKLNLKKVPLKIIHDKNSGFYGQISLIRDYDKHGKRYNNPLSITLNTYYFQNISSNEKAYNYIYNMGWTLEECILETICHEIAHMTYIGHGKSHAKLIL